MIILLLIATLHANILNHIASHTQSETQVQALKATYIKSLNMARSGFADEDALDLYNAFIALESRIKPRLELEEWTEYLDYKKRLLIKLDLNLNLGMCKIRNYPLVRYLVWNEVNGTPLQELEILRCMLQRDKLIVSFGR